jgi:OPA family sugar phosphate sensor protein UhpC-like MFS transporter
MKLFSFFKPAPHLPEIANSEEVKKQYKYWRIRIFLGMYLSYAFFYFSRKSFTFAMPVMSTELGLDKVQLGFLATILSLTYGTSKFVSGVISDKSNPRYFMGIGLILTGIFNVLFGFSSTFTLFAIFWSLNGWFQGWGWPPCAKLLTHWYSQKERGKWWSIWNTSHNIGGSLMPLIGSAIAKYLGWRYAMIIPGLSCIVIGLWSINRLRDVPQSLGLPPIEKFKGDIVEAEHADSDKLSLSAKTILVEYVLKNKYVWTLSIAYFFIYIIRTAINDWTVLFLVEDKQYSLVAAGLTVFWFEIGGFFGSLAAGWSSDYIFGGKRGPVNALFAFGVIFVLLCMWKFSGVSLIAECAILFSIGFFIFGPQMLIGVAAAELSHKKAAGTATGFAGNFAYIGAAAAGAPLGSIAKNYGWEGFFVVLTACGVLATLCLIPLWQAKINPKHVLEK